MTTLSTSFVLPRTISGSRLRPKGQFITGTVPSNLSLRFGRGRSSSISQRPLAIRAGYSDGGRSSSSNSFVGGFILGGLLVGTLGAVYAPQISNALAGADKKDLMRKLPKFIYDEEKALEANFTLRSQSTHVFEKYILWSITENFEVTKWKLRTK